MPPAPQALDRILSTDGLNRATILNCGIGLLPGSRSYPYAVQRHKRRNDRMATAGAESVLLRAIALVTGPEATRTSATTTLRWRRSSRSAREWRSPSRTSMRPRHGPRTGSEWTRTELDHRSTRFCILLVKRHGKPRVTLLSSNAHVAPNIPRCCYPSERHSRSGRPRQPTRTTVVVPPSDIRGHDLVCEGAGLVYVEQGGYGR